METGFTIFSIKIKKEREEIFVFEHAILRGQKIRTLWDRSAEKRIF